MRKNISKFLIASVSFTNPIANDDVIGLIRNVLKWMIWIAVPVAVLVIIYAGALLIFSQGKEEYTKRGKKMLTWAVIGLAIILVGSGFYTFILSVINLGR